MVSTLSSVRQPAVRGCLSSKSIDTTGSPRNVGTTHLLEGSYTGKSPEVTIRDPWEFVLDGFQQPTGDLETRVGAVKGLGFETHGGIIAIIIKRLEQIPGFLDEWWWRGPIEGAGERKRTCHQSWTPCHKYLKSARLDGRERDRRNHL